MAAKFQPIQQSFSGGAISPRMYARSDVEGYQQSVKQASNFLVYPQGPADFRKGFQHIKRLAGSSTDGRIIAFNKSKTEAYAIVVTKDEIRVLSADLLTDTGLVSPYSTDAQVKDIQKGEPPGEDKIILVTGEVAPQHVTHGSPFTTGTQALTNAPTEWTGAVWPKVIGFADGRSWFANIVGDDVRYWGSTSGSFYDFDTGTGLDDEAIDRTLDERGQIQWIVKGRDLTFGTERGIFLLTAAGSVITPSDIQADLESSEGSLFIQGEKAASSILHVSQDGRKMREFTYRLETLRQQWTSKDLSFIAEHLTEDGNNINRIAYSALPDSIGWASTDLGKLLGITYDFDSKIFGWHDHSLGDDSEIVDICNLQYNGTSQLWALVNRNSGLEVVRLGSQYLDHYATQTSATLTTSIGPFTHLANEEVTVLVDGAFGEVITLDGSGNGTLARGGLEFVVGHGYTGTLQSLNTDKGDPSGSAASLFKRWNKLFVYVYNSIVPKINGIRPGTRSPITPMDEAEPLRTEFLQVPTRGFSREGTVTIVQDLPFKTTVLALMGQMKQN